jgi:hypothetical protein
MTSPVRSAFLSRLVRMFSTSSYKVITGIISYSAVGRIEKASLTAQGEAAASAIISQ